MIQHRMIKDRKARSHCAALRIICAVDQTLDSCLNRGSSAHRARLDGHEQRSSEQSIIANGPRGCAESENFRMCRGIAILDSATLPARATDSISLRSPRRAPTRHLAALFFRCACFFGERGFHKRMIQVFEVCQCRTRISRGICRQPSGREALPPASCDEVTVKLSRKRCRRRRLALRRSISPRSL